MNTLTFIFLVCAIVGTGLNIWIETKWGKKWLKELNSNRGDVLFRVACGFP